MEEALRILIVDDDEVDRMVVRRALKSTTLKIELSEAGSYETALTKFQQVKADCILVDYRLPGKDGLALVQDLRDHGTKIPLIVLTGQGDEQIAVELMKAGASDYLPKHRISAPVLERIVRNAMRVYQAEIQVELANQQREQLARQREDFVSRLTHDLRTPLVAADRMLTLFHEGAFGQASSEMQDAISIMIRSNQSLLQMVNTLLEVYRYDAGCKSIALDVCNMQGIVQEVIQELAPLAQEKHLALHTELESREITVWGDRLELRRVITNLLGNAIKFTDIGSIVVRLISAPVGKAMEAKSQPSSWVTIEVGDTGAGIDPLDQATLFDRFRQGDHKRSGSGLGLYLTRRIVETHQGTIMVNSELGKGSLFTVRLPAHA
ncbi:MAG: hybrid sensor histidine kinase/response regulator [Scytolyngbya sp. HA4215-MV1]|jgi:signal transduction histidine kinase|nr:hybrid sensor histidine kinase/response regulator [Scytolyngbya sp. HA4215-MV1]